MSWFDSIAYFLGRKCYPDYPEPKVPVEAYYQFYGSGQPYGEVILMRFESQTEKDAFDEEQKRDMLSEYVEVEKE